MTNLNLQQAMKIRNILHKELNAAKKDYIEKCKSLNEWNQMTDDEKEDRYGALAEWYNVSESQDVKDAEKHVEEVKALHDCMLGLELELVREAAAQIQ